MFAVIANAQINDQGIFGTQSTPVNYDTLATDADTLASRVVYWNGWRSKRGSLSIYGKFWMLSGTSKTITVKWAPLLRYASASDYHLDDDAASWQTLGTKTFSDSVKYNYVVSAQSYWQFLKGFQLLYIVSAQGSQIRAEGRELSR